MLTDTLRLARLAEDLLVLARLDERAGRRAARAAVPLGALAEAEVGRYAEARVPVLLAASEPCTVTGDPDGLRRMLGNLIDNAVRYARSRVTVTVTADGPVRPAGGDRRRTGYSRGRRGAGLRPVHPAGARPQPGLR